MSEVESPQGKRMSWARQGPLGSFPKSTRKFLFTVRPPFSVSTSICSMTEPSLAGDKSAAITDKQTTVPHGAPCPFLAERPRKRGPFLPQLLLLDHVRVELLVPCAVEGVGDVQPLAVQAELHFTRAAVHSLALEAQQTPVTLLPSSFQQEAPAGAGEPSGAEQSGCLPS